MVESNTNKPRFSIISGGGKPSPVSETPAARFEREEKERSKFLEEKGGAQVKTLHNRWLSRHVEEFRTISRIRAGFDPFESDLPPIA
ncbi:MAG: hypothetical protein ACM3IJ_04960 [Candidatus Levyibacteriota bacterium]